MFRFLFAWQPGDHFALLAADGFVGIETAVDSPDGMPVVGLRRTDDVLGEPSSPIRDTAAPVGPKSGGFGYTIVPTDAGQPGHLVGRRLRDYVDRTSAVSDALEYGRGRFRVLVENGPSCSTAMLMWTLVEAAERSFIGIALDLAAAKAAGQTAAVLVPTLNLRIGLVRVHSGQDDLADYARRLAGIGFDGYVVLDPPPGPSRPAAAIALATVFRGIFPAKPAKKVPVKAAATAAPATS